VRFCVCDVLSVEPPELRRTKSMPRVATDRQYGDQARDQVFSLMCGVSIPFIVLYVEYLMLVCPANSVD